jgi:hypothetical protein
LPAPSSRMNQTEWSHWNSVETMACLHTILFHEAIGRNSSDAIQCRQILFRGFECEWEMTYILWFFPFTLRPFLDTLNWKSRFYTAPAFQDWNRIPPDAIVMIEIMDNAWDPAGRHQELRVHRKEKTL